MKLKLLACEILYREFCHFISESPNHVDVEFLPKGLHDMGTTVMKNRLEMALQNIHTDNYDAILLGYALCNNGIIGLQAPDIPLVVPRAHDCITLFMGSRQRYLDYFYTHRGFYYKTSGWMERGSTLTENNTFMPAYSSYVEKYGEDNAKYLQEQMKEMMYHYTGCTYIRTGLGPDQEYLHQAQCDALQHKWKFEVVDADLQLIADLLNGNWDSERFLVVAPHMKIIPTYNDNIITSQKISSLEQGE